MSNVFDVWLRVVDYDDEGIVLQGADDTEAKLTFDEARALPNRGELAKFRVDYDAFCAKGLKAAGVPTLPESDAKFRERLLKFLAHLHVNQARARRTIDVAEWDAAQIASGNDLDKLAGIHGLVRRGSTTTPSPFKE